MRANFLEQKFRVGLQVGLLLTSAVFVACSSPRSHIYQGRLGYPEPRSDVATPRAVTVAPLPWEIWPRGRDLEDIELRSPLIAQGDRQLDEGLRAKALESYYRAQTGPLSVGEQAALALRIASTELALDNAMKALRVLSAYFQTANKSIEDVDGRFSLVFAYSYGRARDLEQSFAWFARVARVGAANQNLRAAAEKGIRLISRSVPDEKLSNLSEIWTQDSFVRGLLGEERARRAAGGSIDVQQSVDIWGQGGVTTAASVPSQSEMVPVGVLLPLSGKYAALGVGTKNGMELALEGQKQIDPAVDNPPLVRLEFRDTGLEALQAASAARELVSANGAGVIVGPLIAEHAIAVLDVVRQTRTPLVALSKNSNFPTGEGAFRLGATVESQVNSLLEASQHQLGIRRYAIVFPDDAAGREFEIIFREALRERGLDLVYEAGYPRGANQDLVKAAEEIESSGAEAVFFPDSLTLAARFFGSFTPAARQRIRPLGAANWDNSAQLANSSTVLNGAVFVSPFFAASERPEIQRFVQSYRGKYNQAPDFLSAQGFDVLTLVQEITRRQQLDQISWSAAAGSIDSYDGLTGKITLRSDGEFSRQFAVVELLDGKPRELRAAETPAYTVHGDETVPRLAETAEQATR